MPPFSIGCVFLLFVVTYGVELSDPDYDEMCHVDIAQPPEALDNYIDCTTEEKVAAGLERCCEVGVDKSKGCCEKDTKLDKMLPICLTIGIVTAVVMTTCFIVFWCNSSTFPWLEKYEDKIICLRKKDRTLAELKPSPSTDPTMPLYNGIGPQYTHEGFQGDEFAPPDKYDMPPELKQSVADDWWEPSKEPPLKIF